MSFWRIISKVQQSLFAIVKQNQIILKHSIETKLKINK